jgi:dynein heavy chain 1
MTAAMNSHLDVPRVAGKILWARQLNETLVTYLKRVKNVLGDDWDMYTQGQKIKQECVVFQQKLDVGPTFKNWMNGIMGANLSVSGPVFQVVKDQRDREKAYHLKVYFNPKLVELFKEVRLLISLGFQIPHSVMSVGRDASRIQPFVISLVETLREYESMNELVGRCCGIVPLVQVWRMQIRDLLMKGGANLKWEYFVNIVSFGIKKSMTLESQGLTKIDLLIL